MLTNATRKTARYKESRIKKSFGPLGYWVWSSILFPFGGSSILFSFGGFSWGSISGTEAGLLSLSSGAESTIFLGTLQMHERWMRRRDAVNTADEALKIVLREIIDPFMCLLIPLYLVGHPW